MTYPGEAVFVRISVGKDERFEGCSVFRTFAAAKAIDWFDQRIKLGLAEWKGDQWYSTLTDHDLGVVCLVRRKNVRSK